MTREIVRDGGTISLVAGDITTVAADAIVNAANSGLRGGGGVDGAIHRAGGPEIMAELRERHRDGCPTGHAVVTGAGALPARWVIHAVGPVWHGGGRGEPQALADAYRRSVELAGELGARTVTLPAISCGVYGYPLDLAAAVAVTAVADGLAAAASVERATFVLRGSEAMSAFERALDGHAPRAAT